jgi:PAS domain S-box-containing protein
MELETNEIPQAPAVSAMPDPKLVHRVVQYRGRRYSLKLDQASWAALEQAASRKGMRLNQLVDELSVATNHEGNFSATVRSHCLAELKEQVRELGEKVRQLSMSGQGVSAALLADACPAPVFVADGTNTMLKANAAAQKWLGLAESALVGKLLDQYFQLKSTQTLGQIVQTFMAGRDQVFPARIVCLRPGRLIMAKANICPVLRKGEGELVYMVIIDLS